nr:hypothetical protein [Tanacetum cinerariifolium]
MSLFVSSIEGKQNLCSFCGTFPKESEPEITEDYRSLKTQSSSDTTITPPTDASTRLSTSAKGKQPAKSSKAKGLSVLFEVAITKAEQIKLAMKKSLQQTHISQASGLGADEGTGILPGVLDVPTDESDKEISWKSSDEYDDDEFARAVSSIPKIVKRYMDQHMNEAVKAAV